MTRPARSANGPTISTHPGLTPVGVDDPPESAHDARGDRPVQVERATKRDRQLPHSEVLAEREYSWHQILGRLDQFQHGDIASDIGSDPLGFDLLTAGECHQEFVCTIHHVGIGNDPLLVKHDARTLALAYSRDQNHRVP